MCARFLRLYECTSPNGKAQLFMRKRDQTCEISLISLRSLAKARIRERDDDEKSESQKRERERSISSFQYDISSLFVTRIFFLRRCVIRDL